VTAKLFGLHHVTAISRSARRTTDFYVNVLGLRLVKQTINHDDPENYHLFLGDQAGRPGSLLTLFPRPTAPNGSYRRILVMA
jgi:glyoxalase family protein